MKVFLFLLAFYSLSQLIIKGHSTERLISIEGKVTVTSPSLILGDFSIECISLLDEIESPVRSVSTNSRGGFVIKDVPSGKYRIIATGEVKVGQDGLVQKVKIQLVGDPSQKGAIISNRDLSSLIELKVIFRNSDSPELVRNYKKAKKPISGGSNEGHSSSKHPMSSGEPVGIVEHPGAPAKKIPMTSHENSRFEEKFRIPMLPDLEISERRRMEAGIRNVKSSSPTEESLLVEKYRKDFKEGLIAFNPPTEMEVDKTETIEVRLTTHEKTEELTKGLGRTSSAPQVEKLKVGVNVRVSLSGSEENFKIKNITPEDRYLDSGQLFEPWQWFITPLKPGTNDVTITVEARIKDKPFYVMPYKRTIMVKVTSGSVSEWFMRNWQWIIGTLILPFGGWLWVLYSKRKGPKENQTE